MGMVDHAVRCVQAPALLKDVVSEYWAPTQPWACWEYLDQTMGIVEEISSPSEMEGSIWFQSVMKDARLRAELWPIPNRALW